MFITYHFRIKDSSCKTRLMKMANRVNFVWNYCNEVSHRSITYNGKWLSFYEMNALTKKCSKELGLMGQTIQYVNLEYIHKRNATKKIKLSWRNQKRSLAWIPFNGNQISLKNEILIYNKLPFKIWKNREIKGKIKSGSFNQDAKGNWFINLVCEIQQMRNYGQFKIIELEWLQ